MLLWKFNSSKNHIKQSLITKSIYQSSTNSIIRFAKLKLKFLWVIFSTNTFFRIINFNQTNNSIQNNKYFSSVNSWYGWRNISELNVESASTHPLSRGFESNRPIYKIISLYREQLCYVDEYIVKVWGIQALCELWMLYER